MSKKKKSAKKSQSSNPPQPDTPSEPEKPVKAPAPPPPDKYERNPALLAVIDSTDGPPGLGFPNRQAPHMPDDQVPIPKEFEKMSASRPGLSHLRPMWIFLFKHARQIGYEEGLHAGRNAIRDNPRFWKTHDDQVKKAVKKERQRWGREGHGSDCFKGSNGKKKATVESEDEEEDEEDEESEYPFSFGPDPWEELGVSLDELGHSIEDNPVLGDPAFVGCLQETMSNERFFAEEDERKRWTEKGHGDQCFTQPDTSAKKASEQPSTRPSTEAKEVQTDDQVIPQPDVQVKEIQTDPEPRPATATPCATPPPSPPPPPKPREAYPEVYSTPPTFELLKGFNWADDVDDSLPITPLSPNGHFSWSR